jgi:hypothetical protein
MERRFTRLRRNYQDMALAIVDRLVSSGTAIDAIKEKLA